MEVVDRIRWIPSFGYDRELDWLLNMHDWMISKKRYWGLALPIYDCRKCGSFDVVGGRDELKRPGDLRLGRVRGPHAAPAVRGRGDDRLLVVRRAVSRIPDVGNPWLDAGIVPFSTLHYREDPEYWKQWFPADFITESFPGQFRNWFYSMLAMSTVLKRTEPYRTIFGYALSSARTAARCTRAGATRSSSTRPPSGWASTSCAGCSRRRAPKTTSTSAGMPPTRPPRAADPVERLRVLRHVRAARRLGSAAGDRRGGGRCGRSWPVLDRWILSRSAGLAAEVGDQLNDYDAVAATRALSAFIDDLSTWYLRRSRDRMRQGADPADQAAAFATLHAALVVLSRTLAPILPFLSEGMYQNLIVSVVPSLPDSVHLTAWPAAEVASFRDEPLERAMATVREAVELARTLRPGGHPRAAAAWPSMDRHPERGLALGDELLALFAEEINVKDVEVIADGSAPVERRVKPLLPRIGKRLGPAIPAVMAAARSGEFEILADGSVQLAGVTLAPDEVEIQATPRPGTAVAEHDGVVVVLDTELTDELRAEGDARELQRAVQDLRRDAGLELDDRIDLWIGGVDGAVSDHLGSVADETLAVLVPGEPPADAVSGEVRLEGGVARIGLRRRAPGGQDR